MTVKKIFIVLASILIGIFPIINLAIVLILSLNKKRKQSIVISIVLLVILLAFIITSNCLTPDTKAYDTISTIGGFITIGTICYSISALIKLLSPAATTLQPVTSANGVPAQAEENTSRPQKTTQSVEDILNQKDENITKTIKINEAYEDQIAELPLLTIIDAKKIVDERLSKGNYQNFEDFASRTRLSGTILDRIRPALNFDIPASSPAASQNTGRCIDF